jgi:hypoxia up-regulated 1
MKPPSLLPALLLGALPLQSLSKAILGVDLGSLYMKVALVQRNSPLEIVTNLHSKRKTEQMVLFDQGSRFYGADASSLMARKPHLTPSQMSVLLGRNADHPSVRVLKERHYHFDPQYNETRSGVCLTVDGEEFTPEELVAMVLSHAKDITAAYGVTSPVKDCVLTVPAFYTQHERRAILDAAELAELNVLALINENSAAALHFGIDRNDKDPLHYLFYNMGAGSVQVSVVRYHSYMRKESKFAKEKSVGSFEVLGSGWDATLGGASFDARLVDYMAEEFNKLWNEKRGHTKDVREVPRAMAKLMIQANKIKHVLSANSDFPIFVDALHDDINYQSHISRAKFEEICHDLLDRAAVPIGNALKMANITLEELDAIEMIGGAMRVPKVQEAVQKAVGGMELGMHLNSDESMALGAAFHGANVSTSFKVRHVGMSDVNPFVVAVDLMELEKKDATEEKKKKGLFGKKKDGDDWNKHATIFKIGSKLGGKKTIAFSMDKDVHVQMSYEESETLPEGTGLSIEQYDVAGVAEFAKEMKDKGLEGMPKVSLQFEMSTSGITQLIKAEAVMEEVSKFGMLMYYFLRYHTQ